MSEPIKITDKRASARIAASGIEIARGYSDIKAALSDHESALRAGRGGAVPTDWSEANEMRRMRVSNRKLGMGTSGGGSIDFATQRPRDPLFYWQQNNIPYDTDKAEDLKKLRELCRILYRSHPLLGSAIDIFSKWPLTDMCFASKDSQLVDFYTHLFFDQLDYEEYLVDVGREYWCALPGEMVTTAAGVQPIETLTVGSRVLTHRGAVKDVITTSTRTLDTTAYHVRPYYGLPLRFTKGHRFYARKQGREGWLEVEDLTTDHEIFVPVDTTVHDRHEVDLWEVLDRAQWDVHGPLVQDPEATVRQRKSAREKHRRLARLGVSEGAIIRRHVDHGRWSMLHQTTYPLDTDLMRLFGLYVAEGCPTDDGVQWSFGSHEDHLAEETQDLVKRIFGIDAKIQRREFTRVVIAYNQPLSAWFGALFGRGATSKSLPEWMMTLPKERLLPLLSGWLDGDGHVARVDGSQGRRWARVCTGSRVLAHQMGRLVRRMSLVSVTYEHHSTTKDNTDCTWWTVGPAMGSTKAFLRDLGWHEDRIEDVGEVVDSPARYATFVDGGYWVRVCSVKASPYQGAVHDIGVADDHSFVASDVAVHNCVGEAWPLGSFNEDLGVWEDDELINPDDVFLEKSPFLKDPRLSIRLPETLRKILRSGQPVHEYQALVRSYPELMHFTGDNAKMPVSNVLLKQLRFKGDTFNPRGVPLMLRGLRPIIQEEMLNSAQDAIADRLYTPLVLAKLGASATDLGTNQPWVPTPDQIGEFESALDVALAADFRVLTTHFAVDMSSVFGRETMPNFDADFERLAGNQLQVFGMSKTMLSGSASGETYAADALNRDLISQLLSVRSDMRTPILQPNRGIVLRSMEQVWNQAEKYHPVDDDGFQQVIDLPVGNNGTYTLCFTNGMGQWGQIRKVIRHWYDGPMVRLMQKWGEVVVTPNHSVYAANGELVAPGTNPELLAIRHLNQPHRPDKEEVEFSIPNCRVEGDWAYRYHKDGAMISHPGAPRKITSAQIKEFFDRRAAGESRATLAKEFGIGVCRLGEIERGVRVWDWEEELRTGVQRVPESQRSGRSKMRKTLKGDDLKCFLEFLGAWISEGSVTVNKCGSGVIQIANSNKAWLERIAARSHVFVGEMSANIQKAMPPEDSRHKQMWSLVMGNRTLGDWLNENAGKGAHHKRLPDFVFGLSRDYVHALLDAMVFGDGSVRESGRWSYHTSSQELAQGVGLLCLLHDIQFTVGKNESTGVYSLNTCDFYISRSDEVRTCEEIPYSGWVYDFEMADASVPNFTVGIGQPVVHNTTHQRNIKRFVKDRMLVVAEAQEHYDYDQRNGKRYPIMEEVLVVDPESGAKRIVEQPKLLVPDLVLRTMNMSAETDTRQFYEALRASGVPISIKTRMVNIPLDLDDEVETTREEQIELAVQAQITRRETYARLMAENLPIPEDLKADFGAKAMDHSKDTKATQPTRIPTIGVDDPNHSALAPTPADMATPPGTPLQPVNPELAPAPGGGQVIPLPTNRAIPPALEGRTRPPESDEQRARMPKPASVKVTTGELDANGDPEEKEYDRGLVAGPRHIGSRRYSGVTADEPLDENFG